LSFDNLGLDARILRAVSDMGYSEPTPIQRDSIPHVLDGRDVVGCAQTGTGKTAAFVLPLLQRVPAKPGGIKALIVTPTRELALQIEGVARAASKHTGHRVAVVYGGVGYEPQRKALRRGVDVLIACPGRLLDLVGNRDCDLSKVEVLVLDEADRMLDMGFWPDVRRIIKLVPARRQNLLFSATMKPEVLKVVAEELHDPIKLEVSPTHTPVDKIAQSIFPVGGKQKTDLLLSLVRDQRLDKVLVFTRTKHRADRVARVLERAGVRGAAIHGNRTQAQRQKALDGFRRGHVKVLVATDVVSRGIDIDDITHVVNFDLPASPADYVHRIGRTARAGRTGTAYSLLAPEEHDNLRDIERTIGSTLVCEDHPGFAYTDERVVPDPEREAVPAKKEYTGKRPGRVGRRRRRGPSN
jgi:ATP-dependent RNA helicase RhlE